MKTPQDLKNSIEDEIVNDRDKPEDVKDESIDIISQKLCPSTDNLCMYDKDLLNFLKKANESPNKNVYHNIVQHLLQIDADSNEMEILKHLEDFVLTERMQSDLRVNKSTSNDEQPIIYKEPPVFQAPPPPPLKDLFLPPPPPPPVPQFPGSETSMTCKQGIKEVLLPQQNPPVPKSKMKIICWDKIPTHEIVGGKNLWTTLAKKHEKDNLKYIDWSQAESLFSLQTVSSSNATLTLNRKSRLIKLLDSQKTFNIDILLEQFKGYKSDNDIVHLVYKGNHSAMGSEKISRLIKLLPEPEEIEVLKHYEGNPDFLARADKFLQLLIDVPSYKLRLECMSLKEDFKDNVPGLQNSISQLLQAGKDLIKCRNLHEVLFIIVLVGNFLNSGKYTGKAGGIKVASLLKLTNVRANANNMNFMHFIADQIKNAQPDILNFAHDLQSLEKVNKINIEQLFSDVKNLVLRLQHVGTQMESPATEKDIKQQMMTFLLKADTQIDNLTTGLNNIESMHLQLCKFFCEDPSKFTLAECFNAFQNFNDNFTSAINERRDFEAKSIIRMKQRTSYGKVSHNANSQFTTIPESSVAKEHFIKPSTKTSGVIHKRIQTFTEENKEIKDIRNFWINSQNQKNNTSKILHTQKSKDDRMKDQEETTLPKEKSIVSQRIQKYLLNIEKANSPQSQSNHNSPVPGSPIESPLPRTYSFRLKYPDNPTIPKFEKIGKRVSSITEHDLQDIIQKLRKTKNDPNVLGDIPQEKLLEHVDRYHSTVQKEEHEQEKLIRNLECSDKTPNISKETPLIKSTSASSLNTSDAGDTPKDKGKSISLFKRLTNKFGFNKNTKGY